ncbi:MAG: hypothetical protein ACTJGH_02760 [Peptoniphilaceae bacterium]
MKKRTKIIAGITAFILIGIVLWFANGLVGNPFSKIIASRNAKQYIKETYPGMELEVKDATYNFKNGRYHVNVKSPTSIDTHFSLDISPTGEVVYDSYNDYVSEKFNTWNRVNMEYRKIVENVLDADDFTYESDIGYGKLKLKEKGSVESIGEVYGLSLDELEIDRKYDISKLAKKSGHIVFYTKDEKVDAKRAGEILLDIKRVFDENKVPFYTISFTLEERTDGDDKSLDGERFEIKEFLYEDIYEEGLLERLKKASNALDEYYKEQDAKK